MGDRTDAGSRETKQGEAKTDPDFRNGFCRNTVMMTGPWDDEW